MFAFDLKSHAVVGGIIFQNPKKMKSLKSSQKGGYISAVAVARSHRGKSLGALLIAAAVEQIHCDGSSSAQLVVTNYGAKQTPFLGNFYKRLGFQRWPLGTPNQARHV